MTTLKVKTKQGHIQTLQVESLLEVDGVSYNATGHSECATQFAYFQGRLEALERVVWPSQVVPAENTTIAE